MSEKLDKEQNDSFLELAVQWILILSGTAICFYGYKEALASD